MPSHYFLKYYKKIIAVVFLMSYGLFALSAHTEEMSAGEIYLLAQERNGRAMEAVRHQIDVKDENGNTALCLAQQNQDKESFKMLLVYGASKDEECYDDKDPICAIIVGEKLKINGAGWLLGAAATAGAVYGITELLDDDSCPSGYSKHYPNAAACGTTGAEGWIHESHWKHKKCGKCTPKTYDTGCTTLWQSVNDCGEHIEGWDFVSSGYSGDEICGICTPKACPILAETPTSIGSNTFYHTVGHCPARQYMVAENVVGVAWKGEQECFRCDYKCDETTGFATINPCQVNSLGNVAYNCVLDAATQCYYRKDPRQCPNENAPNIVGSDPRYTNLDYCPARRNMVAESVSQNGWSGEYGCFSCHYKCDEKNGYSNRTTCETNEAGQVGYICQVDPETQCYYRSNIPNPDSPDGGEKPCPDEFSTDYQNENDCATKGGQKDGWIFSSNGVSGEKICGKCESNTCPENGSVDYTAVDKCPVQPYKVAVAVNPVGYAGAETCYECVYYCDPAQQAFATEAICKANAGTLACELKDGCYVINEGCPEGSSVWVENCNDKTHPSGWTLTSVGTASNGKDCNVCVAKTCELPNITDVSTCGTSGENGWRLVGNGYAGDDICQICEAKTCHTGYITQSECNSKNGGIVNAIWTQDAAGGYAGDTPCGTCTESCQVDGTRYFASEEDCNNKKNYNYLQCTAQTVGSEICYELQEIPCPDNYSVTSAKSAADCPVYTQAARLGLTHLVTFDMKTDITYPGDNHCTKCGFNCDANNSATGENHLVTSPYYCKADDGWIMEQIGSYACYWCAMTECNGIRGDAITADDCYDVACANIECACSKAEHTFNVYSEAKSGGVKCNICGYAPTCPNGYQKEEEGADTETYECIGATKCYKTNVSAAMMSRMRDVVNNQTLVINHDEGDYYGDITINASATAPETDEITGETAGGDAVGSITLYNSASNADVSLQYSAGKSLYNASANGTDAAEQVSATGTLNLIMEKGAENTTAAAISSGVDAYNAYALNNAAATGVIDIQDTEAATNVIYGIQARRNAYNAYTNGENATASGQININTATDLAAYGIYAGENIYNQSTPNQTSIVNVTGSGAGSLYGLYSEAGSVYNSGDINVHAADGNAYGIYVNNGGGQIIDNSGNIIVASDTQTAYGIYISNGGETDNGVTVINSGLIDATGDANSRGIKIATNGANATVTNTGQIIVNGSLNSEDTAIDLGGATLSNSGEIEFLGQQNLNALNGRVAVEKGGTYKAEVLSGDIHVAQSVVKEGFENVYQAQNAVQAENGGLNVISDSAMFTGSLQQNDKGNYDIVASRRHFNEFSPNASIASYLEENYKQQRLEELYTELKSASTDDSLKQNILSSTGADMLINLPQENLNALRHASEAVAESILTPTDEINRIMSGADAYYMDADGRRGASGYETTAATAFMYGDKRLDNKNRLGLGLAFMQMHSSYDNGADRDESFVSLFVPWLHSFTDKLRLASILSLGYGYGDYDRGSNRDAYINDIIYGLTNKLVYSINLADFAELEPALVLNAIGYYQDDMDEGDLVVKGGNHLSVEAGAGLYLKKELLNSKYGKLTARLGGMYYHELADPYHKIRAGFRGGVGTFSINDFADIYSRDRAVLSAMLDYEYKRLALYLKYQQMLQRNKAQNFDMGIRYNF